MSYSTVGNHGVLQNAIFLTTDSDLDCNPKSVAKYPFTLTLTNVVGGNCDVNKYQYTVKPVYIVHAL